MSGLIEGISTATNTTTQTSGTVFSASILRGLMKENYDNSNGDVATDIFVSSYLSNKIDEFTNKTYTVVNGTNDTSIVHAVDVFETGIGKVRKHTHRFISIPGTDSYARVLALRPEKFEIGYLRRPYIQTDLAKSGDYDFRAVVGKLTLRVHNQTSNWWADGYDFTT